MHKIDAVLAIVQAHISIHYDARIDHLYAQLAYHQIQLRTLLDELPEDADVFSGQALQYVVGSAGKPQWMADIGL